MSNISRFMGFFIAILIINPLIINTIILKQCGNYDVLCLEPSKSDSSVQCSNELDFFQIKDQKHSVLDSTLDEYINSGTYDSNRVVERKDWRTGIKSISTIGIANLDFDIDNMLKSSSKAKLGEYYYFQEDFQNPDEIKKLISDPNIVFLQSNVRKDHFVDFNSKSNINNALDSSSELLSDFFDLPSIYANYGVNGSGAIISVHDTGVDLGTLGLNDSIALDSEGKPTSFDPSGIGIGILPISQSNSTGLILSGTDLYLNLVNKDPQTWVGTSYQLMNVSNFLSSLQNFKITGIVSKSGVYKFGILTLGDYSSGQPQRRLPLQFFFCLVTDSENSGIYDTLYIDWETSYNQTATYWKEFTLVPQTVNADWDFSNNVPHKWDDGSFILNKDLVNQIGERTPDGYPDLSVGILANVKDTYSIGALYGADNQVIRGIDPSGAVIGIVAPSFEIHGSNVAFTIAGRNQTGWTINDELTTPFVVENDSQSFFQGVAPGSKIQAITGTDLASDIEGWLWACGFDLNSSGWWEYTGNHESDIDVNSWGVQQPTYQETLAGFDILTLIVDTLAVPEYIDTEYTGKLFIGSMGNSGYGIGTGHSPSSSASMLVVGGSTLTSDDPFGPNTGHEDEIWSFSSRGPNSFGYTKPDIVCPASNTFVPTAISFGLNIGTNAWTSWSGTSLAAPIVAGACALLLELNQSLSPDEIKIIVKSSSKDLGYNGIDQGAGRLDIIRAMQLAICNYTDPRDGSPIIKISSYDPFKEAGKIINKAFANQFQELSYIEINDQFHPSFNIDYLDTALYGGYMTSGHSKSFEMNVYNNNSGDIEISAVKQNKISVLSFESQTSDSYTLVNLTDEIIDELGSSGIETFNESTLIQIRVTFDSVEIDTRISNEISTPLALLIDYNDSINHGVLDLYQEDPNNYDYVKKVTESVISSKVIELSVGYPESDFNFFPTLVLFDQAYSLRNTISFSVSITMYSYESWDWIKFDSMSSSRLVATISVPNESPAGFYNGYLRLNQGESNLSVPISFLIVEELPVGPSKVQVEFNSDNRFLSQLNEWNPCDLGLESGSRLSGDWRLFTFNLTNPLATFVATKVNWTSMETMVDVYVFGPSGRLIETSNIVYWKSGRYNSTSTGINENLILAPVESMGEYRVGLHLVRSSGSEDGQISLAAFCLTEQLTPKIQFFSSNNVLSNNSSLTGPHADLTTEIGLISSQIPELKIKQTKLEILSGFEKVFYDTISENEAIPSYSIESWIEIYLEAGELVHLIGSFAADDFDFYVFGPSSEFGPNSLPSSQSIALEADLLRGTMVEAVNPERGMFYTQENGTYKIGIDAFTGSGDFELILSTLIGIEKLANGENVSIDTHSLQKNGEFLARGQYTTTSNLIFNEELHLMIENYFAPKITLYSPVGGDKYYNELNDRLRDRISISWNVVDLNSQDELIISTISLNLPNQDWVIINETYGTGNFTFTWDPNRFPLNDSYRIKISAIDNSSYQFFTEVTSGEFILTRRRGLQINGFEVFLAIFSMGVFVKLFTLEKRGNKRKYSS